MTAAAITLRLACPRDAQALAVMSRDLIETGLGWGYQPERILRLIQDRETIALVACERRRLAGFAIMEFNDERAHLVLLAVRTNRRRQGIGRRMLDWLVESALTAGIESVHLEIREGNEAARGFYRAAGFVETLRVPGYYRGWESAVRMLRMLRAIGPLPINWRPPSLDPE